MALVCSFDFGRAFHPQSREALMRRHWRHVVAQLSGFHVTHHRHTLQMFHFVEGTDQCQHSGFWYALGGVGMKVLALLVYPEVGEGTVFPQLFRSSPECPNAGLSTS